jgi:predicted dehydrogenase
MSEVQSEPTLCPDNIAIIGGGRWARVIVSVLCELVSSDVNISMHFRHNMDSMVAWVKKQGLADRINLSSEWPQFSSPSSSAIIVANAARDHAAAVEHALSIGASVLVEKPIAINSTAAEKLAKLARKGNGQIAAAQVFLFARYIENFSKLITSSGPVDAIFVDWADPKIEQRYGETKQYDAGLPLFADWLPHILPILDTLLPTLPDEYSQLKVSRGGATIELELKADKIPCVVRLERNASYRKRTIQVIIEGKPAKLDFSKEPGVINFAQSSTTGDEFWNSGKKPLACMLSAFLALSTSTDHDARFDIGTGLQACRIIDKITKSYYEHLIPVLIEHLSGSKELNESFYYMLSELLSAKGPLTANVLSQQIEKVITCFDGEDRATYCEQLTRAHDPSGFLIDMIT